MSRSGYTGDIYSAEDQARAICWSGAVLSALRGRRGQAFLRELLAALDALPQKELIVGDLEKDGAVCALGSVGRSRGMDMRTIDPEDREAVAGVFGIAEAMAAEIMYENDEGSFRVKTPRQRWEHMRAWAIKHLHGDLK